MAEVFFNQGLPILFLLSSSISYLQGLPWIPLSCQSLAASLAPPTNLHSTLQAFAVQWDLSSFPGTRGTYFHVCIRSNPKSVVLSPCQLPHAFSPFPSQPAQGRTAGTQATTQARLLSSTGLSWASMSRRIASPSRFQGLGVPPWTTCSLQSTSSPQPGFHMLGFQQLWTRGKLHPCRTWMTKFKKDHFWKSIAMTCIVFSSYWRF